MQQLNQHDTQPQKAPAGRRRPGPEAPPPIGDHEAHAPHPQEEQILRAIALELRDGPSESR